MSRAQVQTQFAALRSFTRGYRRSHKSSTSPKGGRTILWAGTGLSPLALVSLQDHGDDASGKTGEQQMLEASRAELEQQVPKALEHSKKWTRSLWSFLDVWIIEPVATGLRFLHLVVIFVPVIVTVPAIWFGARQKDKDGERSGTLWWYNFLVKSMERAGAAFIKVC